MSAIVEIQNKPEDTGVKGTLFRATLIASVSVLAHKPAEEQSIALQYGVLASSTSEMRAFIANLHVGRRFANASSDVSWNHGKTPVAQRMGFLKGSFSCRSEVVDGYTRATVYQRGLFELNPGVMSADGIKMMILIPESWGGITGVDLPESRERLRLAGYDLDAFQDEEVLRGLSDGALLLTYLERRTLFPFPACPVLGFMLWGALQSDGFLVACREDISTKVISVSGMSEIGARAVVSVSCSHVELERTLRECVLQWNQGRKRGKT